MKLSRQTLLVLLIIGVGVFLRLIRLSELFHFTYDEEIIAFVGKRMIVNHKIPFIGGVTPMHVHVGPYYYWLSGLFLFFSKLDPLGWGVAAALIAAATMATLYKTAKLLFNQSVALVTISLYAFSFYQNIFDRHYWGLMLDGILSILTILSLHKILSGAYSYVWLLAIVLTFGFHVDPSTLVLWILTAAVLVIKKKSVNFRKVLIPICTVFIIALAPLVIFDIRHNFSNSRGVLQYVEEIKSGRVGVIRTTSTDALLFVPRALARTLYISGNTDLSEQYSYCPEYAIGRLRDVSWPLTVSVIGIVLTGLYFTLKKNPNQQSLQLILLLIGATAVGITLYGFVFKGDLFDHYLATLFPIFLLLTAYVSARLLKNWPLIFTLLLIGFVLINVPQIFSVTHRYGLADKRAAIQWAIDQTGSEPYSLDVLGSCFRYNGYRYLTYIAGKEPAKSYVDANFTHLFDIAPASVHPRLLVVITNPSENETEIYKTEYESLHEQLIKKAQFGNIEVLLVNNENLRFVGKY